MRGRPSLTSITVGLSLAMLFLAWPASRAELGDDKELARQLSELDNRLRTMEKAVGLRVSDTTQETIVHRLDMLEGVVRDLVRATGGTPRPSVSGDARELERQVKGSEREQAELQRRLEGMERAIQEVSAQRGELRSLRTALDGLERRVDDLARRVK